MKKQILAVVLSSVMLLGATFASSRNAYAHTFSDDESASFLLLVESIKVELDLVQSNHASEVELAVEHAEHAHEHLDEHIIEEISERNERLGRDLPAALEDLHDSVADSTEQEVQTKIQTINDLLDETVTVRVESAQMTNSTVNALVMANMLTAISFQGHGHYEIALGIGEDHAHEEEHDEHEEDEHSSEEEHMTEGPVEIVDMAHYQTAQAYAVRAQELWNELKTEAPPTAAQAIVEIDSALPDLVEALNDKASNADVQVIIHGRIHPNLITTFGLVLAGDTEEHEEDEHGAHSAIPEKLMMYAMETGDHIHEEHLEENAPISTYEADARYTLTLTGEAMAMSHDEMEDDSMEMSEDDSTTEAEITLELATWKSDGRVLYLDIIGGTVTVGDETMTVNAGQGYYVMNGRLMFAFAVVTPEDEESAHLLKMRAVLDDGILPGAGSDQPLDIVDSRTKIGSDWSLNMSGQVALS